MNDGSTRHERRLGGGYAEAFAEVQRQLRLGNSYEVNLTYRERVESALDPVTAYLRLRELNPAPYSGYLQHHGVHLLSSSPERFATIDRHRTLEARPIKGTTPRGATAEECLRKSAERGGPGGEPADVARATRTVLDEPAYREAARRVAAELAAMPDPASLVPRLEALAAAGADGVLSA